jgi:hypothetical protein
LFDDCLCYASLSNMKSATMKHVIPLANVDVEDLEDSAEWQNVFLIKSSYKSIVVSAASVDLKESWIRDLMIHSQILTNNYATLQRVPPQGEELEKQIIQPVGAKGKAASILTGTTLDPTTIAEKQAKLESLSRDSVVLLSEKQRDRLRQKALKGSDEIAMRTASLSVYMQDIL